MKNTWTIRDFELVDTKIHKFAQELFAGNDEKKKLQFLEGMENLMNPKPISIKRPIDVADIVSEAKRIKLTATKVPNEIWMKIMSYLKNKDIFGNFALVNKHFHGLTMDPCAVKYLHLEDLNNKAKSKVLYGKWMKVIKRSKGLLELKISDQNKVLDWNKLIMTALNTNRGLRSFDSNYAILSQDFINEICKLKTLKSIHVGFSGGSVTPEFVKKLAFSQNPIESFTPRMQGDRMSISNAIKILYMEKKNTIKTLNTFNLRDQIDHHENTPKIVSGGVFIIIYHQKKKTGRNSKF